MQPVPKRLKIPFKRMRNIKASTGVFYRLGCSTGDFGRGFLLQLEWIEVTISQEQAVTFYSPKLTLKT